VVLSILTGP
jgi:pSer/pThr/pTyr-binding forkhead associated (FHA) protein